MSWIQGGLGRLLQTGSSKGDTAAATAQQRPAAAAATSPTRASHAQANAKLTEKQPSPRSWADCSPQSPGTKPELVGTGRRISEPQELLDGPGSVYSLLPCIKQLRPSRSAADQLAAAVLGALPGIRLDSSWVVYPSGPRSGLHKVEACICILPELQPPGYFCSTSGVITFLRELRDTGVALPGVLHQPQAPTSPASAQRHTAAVTAALLTCGAAFKFIEATDSVRDSTGSGEVDLTAEEDMEQQHEQQQHRRVSAKRAREQQQQQPPEEEERQQGRHAQLQQGSTHKGAPDTRDHQQQQRGPKRRRSSLGGSSLDGNSSGISQLPTQAMEKDPPAAAAAAAAAHEAAAVAAAAADSPLQDAATSSGPTRSRRSSGQEAAATQHARDAASALLHSLRGSPADAGQQQQQQGRQGQGCLAPPLELHSIEAAGGSRASSARVSPAVAAVAAAAAAAGVAAGPLASAGDLPSDSAAAAPAAAAAAAAGGSAGSQQAAAAAAAGAAAQGIDVIDPSEWQIIHRLQSLRSAAAFVSGQVRLNRVDAKLESIRRAALMLGRTPSLSAEMAAPVALKPPKAPSPVLAAAALAKPYTVDASARLPPKPRPSSSSGGGSSGGGAGAGSGGSSSRKRQATNTFTAASDVKAMSKLDSLFRAKEAAAAIKAAVQAGQPYEGTVEQRHHAMRQQLRQQLPDGRVPCAESLASLQELLSAQLPGARLDSEWLVYPGTPQDSVPKLDILVRHPRLGLGYFRSYRSVVNFYANLTGLLKGPRHAGGYYYASRELCIPGLSLLPDALPQQHRQGCSPGELNSLMVKAARALGRSFIREAGAAGAAAASSEERGASPGSSDGHVGYPVGGARAAAANAAAVAARQWQPPPLVANLPPPRKGSSVLVLGMFYASEPTAMESHNGLAQYRDRIRLCALHKQLDYIPHSFDRDHEVELAETAATEDGKSFPLHVQGNFNSKRGAGAVADRFPDTRFTAVLLDYFRMPSGYAGDIYKSQLFLDFIPELVRRGNLPAGVPIYIPNSPVLLEQLAGSGAFADYGDVVAIPARSYLLFEATRHAEATGQMPAKYSNVGQVRELVPGAEFIVVHYCGDATPPV